MNRAASAPNGMRNDEAKQRASRIEKPCHAWMYWRVSVGDDMTARDAGNGMMLTTCPR